jgi:hypothetical protein
VVDAMHAYVSLILFTRSDRDDHFYCYEIDLYKIYHRKTASGLSLFFRFFNAWFHIWQCKKSERAEIEKYGLFKSVKSTFNTQAYKKLPE